MFEFVAPVKFSKLRKVLGNKKLHMFFRRFGVLFAAGLLIVLVMAFFGEPLPLVHYLKTAFEAAGEAGADVLGEEG